MGATAVTVLAAAGTVTDLVVADRDLDAARRAVAAVAGKATAAQIDALDRGALVARMRDADVVVSTVGPYFRFGLPILAAAIEAGCDYIDICDDPDPTRKMLELSEEAEAAGVCALVGAGASPGIANMLAVTAGRQLDSVDTAVTGWNIAAAHPEPRHRGEVSAAVVHMMEQISGTIPVTRDGRLTQRAALELIPVDYPGLGRVFGRSIGHPEAVTLARAFPSLRESTNVCVGDRITMTVVSGMRRLLDRKLLTVDRAAQILDRLFAVLPMSPTDFVAPGSPPPLFAVVTGTRDGRPATAATALGQVPGFSMAAATGIPLAVMALLLPTSRRPGVHVPESLIEPEAFFAALAPHCIGSATPATMTVTTASWHDEETNRRALQSTLLTALLSAGAA